MAKAAIKILEISEAICERAVDFLLQEERVIQHIRVNNL